MLDFDAQPCEGTVGLLLVIAQAFAGRLFLGRDAVGTNFSDALIAVVSSTQRHLREPDFTTLEQAQVMGATFACNNREKLSLLKVNYHLSFGRVTLVLAAVVSPLFSWGAQWQLQSRR